MKKSRHTEKQIIEIMGEAETGTNVDEVCTEIMESAGVVFTNGNRNTAGWKKQN